jgi:protein-S-isoprenylcysteine O-methyltransferase Ste14
VPPLIASTVSQFAVVAGSFAFAVLFAWLRPRERGRVKAVGRARGGRVGFLIQGVAFALVFSIQRPNRGMLGLSPSAPDIGLAVLVIALMCLALGLAVGALRALGRQWAVGARVIEGHKLVTTGPFALVRHPIYSGMGGMLIASGLVLSAWWALAAAIAFYSAGMIVRVRAEEKLLLEAFGEEYEAYRARVPAVVPWRGGHLNCARS